MSRTMHFGRDVLAAPDVDLEDLLSALAPSEVTQLVDEMAADPDDKHLPVGYPSGSESCCDRFRLHRVA